MHQNPRSPNAARVKAGKLNRLKRGPLTDAGRERLRQAAQANQPWRASTGPRTPEGKAQATRNGKVRQQGQKSVREIRQTLADVSGLVKDMATGRKVVSGLLSGLG